MCWNVFECRMLHVCAKRTNQYWMCCCARESYYSYRITAFFAAVIAATACIETSLTADDFRKRHTHAFRLSVAHPLLKRSSTAWPHGMCAVMIWVSSSRFRTLQFAKKTEVRWREKVKQNTSVYRSDPHLLNIFFSWFYYYIIIDVAESPVIAALQSNVQPEIVVALSF